MKYCLLIQSCGHCIPSLVLCIRQSSISMCGSNDVLWEHVSYWTCMLLFDYMQTWTMRYKGALLHFPKMIKPRAVELEAHIQSQIWNNEELRHLITSLQYSHARVFNNMDVVVHAHVIPSIGTLTQAKTKAQVQLELDSYFDKLMCIATSSDLAISADIMQNYVIGLTTLKTMMCMLSNELDKGAQVVYPDAMEARFCFQKDVTL